jgi:hypothetical protein
MLSPRWRLLPSLHSMKESFVRIRRCMHLKTVPCFLVVEQRTRCLILCILRSPQKSKDSSRLALTKMETWPWTSPFMLEEHSSLCRRCNKYSRWKPNFLFVVWSTRCSFWRVFAAPSMIKSPLAKICPEVMKLVHILLFRHSMKRALCVDDTISTRYFKHCFLLFEWGKPCLGERELICGVWLQTRRPCLSLAKKRRLQEVSPCDKELCSQRNKKSRFKPCFLLVY